MTTSVTNNDWKSPKWRPFRLSGETADMRLYATLVIIMVPDALARSKHNAISNHRGNSAITSVTNYMIHCNAIYHWLRAYTKWSLGPLLLTWCNFWSLGMDKLFHPTLNNGCNYLSKLGLKLNPESKMGYWSCENVASCIHRRRICASVKKLSLVQVMVCRFFGANPLPKPMLTYSRLALRNELRWNFNQDVTIFSQRISFGKSQSPIPFMPRWVEKVFISPHYII